MFSFSLYKDIMLDQNTQPTTDNKSLLFKILGNETHIIGHDIN